MAWCGGSDYREQTAPNTACLAVNGKPQSHATAIGVHAVFSVPDDY
jgi:hypothetical protein